MMLNALTAFGSRDAAFTIGMLPLTAYVPAILVLHLLSDSGFFRATPIWCTGLLGIYAERILVKLIARISASSGIPHTYSVLIQLLILLTVTLILCFTAVRYIRKPFHQYVRCSDIDRSLPTTLVLLLMAVFSYFFNGPHNSVESILP